MKIPTNTIFAAALICGVMSLGFAAKAGDDAYAPSSTELSVRFASLDAAMGFYDASGLADTGPGAACVTHMLRDGGATPYWVHSC